MVTARRRKRSLKRKTENDVEMRGFTKRKRIKRKGNLSKKMIRKLAEKHERGIVVIAKRKKKS